MSGGILGMFSPQGQGSGLLGNIGQSVSDNSDSLIGLGMGLMSGDMESASKGWIQGQAVSNLRQKQKLLQDQELQKNTAAKALAQKYNLPPELATDADTVFGAVKSIEMQKRTPKEMPAGYRDWQLQQSDPAYAAYKAKNTDTEFGLSPVYGTGPDGKPTLIQLGKNGTSRATPLPEGFNISRDPIKVDGPTGTTILDPQTRQVIQFIPKDVAGAARQEALGKAEGANIGSAGNQINAADDALALTGQIKTHEGRTGATGWQSNFKTTPGGKSADFENLVEQAKSGAFLTAITQMKGLGALSDAEGKAATAAVNRMNVATSDEGFLKAVNDYEAYVKRGKAKAEQILKSQGGGSQSQSAPQRLRYDPATGQLK